VKRDRIEKIAVRRNNWARGMRKVRDIRSPEKSSKTKHHLGYCMSSRHSVQMVAVSFLAATVAYCGGTAFAQSSAILEQRLKKIMEPAGVRSLPLRHQVHLRGNGDVFYD